MAAASGVWMWTRGGGDPAGADTPAAQDYAAGVEAVGAGEVAWQVEQGPAPKAVGADDYWVTDDHLVRRLRGRVVAYELTTGKVAWGMRTAAAHRPPNRSTSRVVPPPRSPRRLGQDRSPVSATIPGRSCH